MANQNDMVLSHMLNLGPITPKEALERYGVMRLGARIYDLKRMGFEIKKETAVGVNRFGDTVRYARYSIAKGGSEA